MTDTPPKQLSDTMLHALRVLEYPRVRDIVASLAQSAEGQSSIIASVPTGDVGDARSMLAATSELLDALRFDDPLPGTGLHDLTGVFRVLAVRDYTLDVEQLLAVAHNIATAAAVHGYFADRVEKYPLAWASLEELEPHEDIARDIERTILPNGDIADDATPELRRIRRRLTRARDALRSIVETVLDKLSDDIVSERVLTLREGRFVIPVRDGMKNRVPGAVHDRSQTGRTLFIEPLASIEGNNEVRELELAERAEIHRILTGLSDAVRAVTADLVHNQELLVRLDIVAARARFGYRVDGVIPVIGDEPVIAIRGGRHPLLEWKHREGGHADESRVVPLTLTMGGDTATVVVTGPNAGGKTVALKTTGLLTLMAMSGMPVPAGEGTAVYVPDGVYADIGDEQSIENDLSTFSSHMTNIIAIVREAKTGSLVLLDELGGATNPADGEAIALAVLRRLTGAGALTVATTHHDGLKVFAHETPGVVNASMEFDKENLRPTFAFRMGIPGSSYAFEIAARLGMPSGVLRDAEALAGGERKTLEGLIAEMEAHVQRADEERRLAEKERRETEAARADLDRRLADLKDRRDELMRKAVDDSRRLLDDANRRIETAVRDIRESSASHESIVAAKEAVRETVETVETTADRVAAPEKGPRRKPAGRLEKGMHVWSNAFNAEAVVEDVSDRGRKARIRVGAGKAAVVVEARDLSRLDAPPDRREQRVVVNVRSEGVDSTEIDLRGMTFEEAREELESFFARLRMTGFDRAYVIHGKGTGALRRKIGGWLDTHPSVVSHRLGDWNEGGSGMTVVELKK